MNVTLDVIGFVLVLAPVSSSSTPTSAIRFSSVWWPATGPTARFPRPAATADDQHHDPLLQ
jgi:hypothetical protein